MAITEVMVHMLKDTIEVEQMRTHTIIIPIQVLAIQMAMAITIVIILHHIVIHQTGIHQVIMITTMIMDIVTTMGTTIKNKLLFIH